MDSPPSSSRDARRPSDRVAFGRRAERLVAAWYARARGGVLLASNLRLGRDELDLLLREGSRARIVEVRSSGCRDAPDLAWGVVGRKASRLRRAAGRLLVDLLPELLGFVPVPAPAPAPAAPAFPAAVSIDLAFVCWPPGRVPQVEVWLDALPLQGPGCYG